jgi:hypothetical protein
MDMDEKQIVKDDIRIAEIKKRKEIELSEERKEIEKLEKFGIVGNSVHDLTRFKDTFRERIIKCKKILSSSYIDIDEINKTELQSIQYTLLNIQTMCSENMLMFSKNFPKIIEKIDSNYDFIKFFVRDDSREPIDFKEAIKSFIESKFLVSKFPSLKSWNTQKLYHRLMVFHLKCLTTTLRYSR